MKDSDQSRTGKLLGYAASHTIRWRIVLSAVLLGLVLYLIQATPPWEPELKERIAERDATNKLWRTMDYALFYSWWAALFNAVIISTLLIISKWWSGKQKPETTQGTLLSQPGGQGQILSRRTFLILLGIIVGIGIYERAPRLDHSFWNDEEYGFRRYTYGFHRPDKSGDGVELKRIGWEETLFRNRLNNHILHSISARTVHEFWESNLKSEDDPPFKESVIRAAPFVCGVGSILATALLLGMLGHRAAGLCAALFLALNPWHMRFSVEARGYAYAMLFIVLATMFAFMALRDGKWRNWLLFGFAEACLFLSNFGSVFVLILLNLGLLLILALNGKSGYVFGDRGLLLKRWLVANTLAAAVVIQIAMPSIPQIQATLEGGLGLNASMGAKWWLEIWTLLAAGVDWTGTSPSLHNSTNALLELERSKLFGVWVFGIFPILALLGLIVSIVKYRAALLAGIISILAAVITWGLNESKDFFLHSWYINYSVMGVAIFFGLGCGWLIVLLKNNARLNNLTGSIAGIVIVAMAFSIYALGTNNGRKSIREYDRQPARQAIEMVRGVPAPAPVAGDEGPIVGSFGTAWEMVLSYQPELNEIDTEEDLKRLISLSQESGRDLYVLLCGRFVAMRNGNHELVVRLCEDPDLFEPEVYLKGLEELYSYRIFKLKRPN